MRAAQHPLLLVVTVPYPAGPRTKRKEETAMPRKQKINLKPGQKKRLRDGGGEVSMDRKGTIKIDPNKQK